jgi:Ca2+-transporting ATPase
MQRVLTPDRLEGLPDTDQGLTAAAVIDRRSRYGGNRIMETFESGWRHLLVESLKDPMLWFLLGTSLLFALVGERVESLILLLALIPILGMDGFLHRRTQASVAGLSSQLASHTRVVRDGTARNIDAVELVVGDQVLLEAGEAVPADGIFSQADNLQVDESSLTGEAYPVRKHALAAPYRPDGNGQVGELHWGFAGTRVLTGRAVLHVCYTGSETLYGEIVRTALRGTQERTPMQQAVTGLVKVLVIAAALVCVFLAWVRFRQGHGIVDALLSALTLAIAALPEEFPVVMTFFLGVGVYRLARRKALVRRGVAVENIGRVTCICSDKTGTITLGRLQLAHQYPATGIDESGLLRIAAAASRHESADPLDLAILHTRPADGGTETVACFPFTEDRKRETAIIAEHDVLRAVVKGAPETVLSLCDLPAGEREDWQRQVQELADSAHKVIACAWRELGSRPWSGGEPDQGFRFAGLLAFEDPLRAEAAAAVAACRDAGIRVIMVTGDHPATAAAVAREVGLRGTEPHVISGEAMAERIAAEGGEFLRRVDVVARAVPAQKLALVRTLQAQGEIVAVTGDGVNDVPALQAADIGIAMGGRGTRSAREIASIVLLDDNFHSIVQAVAEGRQLFSNLQRSFAYLLMIHLPLVATAAMVPLAGYPLLYLPVHVVWLELIIHPTALLVFQDLPAGKILPARRQPRERRFFSRGQWLSIVLSGVLVTILVMAGYDRALGVGYDVPHARAMALVALNVASACITIALSGLRNTAAVVMVVATICLALVLVQVSTLAGYLHLHPLHLDDWLIAIGGGLLAALVPALGPLRYRRRCRL